MDPQASPDITLPPGAKLIRSPSAVGLKLPPGAKLIRGPNQPATTAPAATATPQQPTTVIAPNVLPPAGSRGFKGSGGMLQPGQKTDPNFGMKPFDPNSPPDPNHPNITWQDITGDVSTAGRGFWSAAEVAAGRLPDVSPQGTDFLDRMVMMDPARNEASRLLYLQHRYGKDNVFTDPGGELYVKLSNGAKVYPSGSGAWENLAASLAASAPEQLTWEAGASYGGALGAETGPWTALVGATLGGVGGYFLGKKTKEASQMAVGEYAKSDEEAMQSDLQDAATVAAFAGVGSGLPAAGRALMQRVVRPWWKITPEVARLTNRATNLGGAPPLSTALPGSTVFKWHQAFMQKLVGNPAEARNILAVRHDLHQVFLDSGMTQDEAKAAGDAVFNSGQAIPTKEVGGEIQDTVRAHTDAKLAEAEAAKNTVQKELDASLAQLRLNTKAMKGSPREDGALVPTTAKKLWQDTAAAIQTARKQFGRAMQRGYAQIDRLVGDKPIIPHYIAQKYAQRLVDKLKPESDIRRIVQEIADWKGPQTLENMQRMRTRLHEMGEPSDLAAAGMTKRDFRQLAKLVDVSFSRADVVGIAEGNAPKAIKLLRKMDALYAEGIKKFSDESVNNIVDAAKTGVFPDANKLVEEILTPGQSDRAAQIMGLLPRELQDRVRGEFFNHLMETAKGADNQVRAATLLNRINRPDFRTLLAGVYGKKTADEFVNYVKGLASRVPNSKIPVGTLAPGRLMESLKAAEAAQASLDDFLKKNFMSELVKPTMNPEVVYQHLIARGNESELEKAVTFLEAHNPQALVRLRQLALTDLAHRAIEKIGTATIVGPEALQRALADMTPRQQELLFPGPLADSLKTVADTASHLFPKSGPNMAASLAAGAVLHALPFGVIAGGVSGLHAGELAGMVFISSAFWNYILSKPGTIIALSEGLKSPGPARTIATNAMRYLWRAAALGIIGELPDNGPDIPLATDPSEPKQ